MQFIAILLVAAAVFGVCHLIDKAFTKKFRSKAQHMSGMAVRANKMYGVFGIVLIVLGVLAIGVGFSGSWLLMVGGIIVLLMGGYLSAYYLGFGIFYDGESFLVSALGKKSTTHRYSEITEQKLYLLQGGNILVELYLTDGSTVTLQSTMDGIYLFLDTAFAGWCLQTGRNPESCDFHDPSKHWWFPHEEEA
jgi:hypothetical protein